MDYNASCNMTRECDERKYLQCSRKICLCYDSYYAFNQECFPSKLKNLILDLASMHLLLNTDDTKDLLSVQNFLIYLIYTFIKVYSFNIEQLNFIVILFSE